MSRDFRTQGTHDAYETYKATGCLIDKCPMCSKESVVEFTHWRIVQNRFPYDAIARRHDMLVTKRHITEAELSEAEKLELAELKQNGLDEYHFILESLQHVKSVPAHHHLHLIAPKPNL